MVRCFLAKGFQPYGFQWGHYIDTEASSKKKTTVSYNKKAKRVWIFALLQQHSLLVKQIHASTHFWQSNVYLFETKVKTIAYAITFLSCKILSPKIVNLLSCLLSVCLKSQWFFLLKPALLGHISQPYSQQNISTDMVIFKLTQFSNSCFLQYLVTFVWS